MKLSAKITSWQNAGIITPKQGADILDFEKLRAKPYALYGFIALAVFCIGLGVVSVIAANWEHITAMLKLIADFALLAGVGGLVYYADYKKWNIRFEAFLCLFVLLVLATIGLIAQVYQLQPSGLEAYLLWSLLVFPLLWVTKKPLLPLVMLPVFTFSFWDFMADNKTTQEILRQMTDSWEYSAPVLWTFVWLLIWQMLVVFVQNSAAAFKKALKFWLIVFTGLLVISIDFSGDIMLVVPFSENGSGVLTAFLVSVAIGLTAISAYLGYISGKKFLIPAFMALIIAGSFVNLGALLSFAALLLIGLYAWRNNSVKILNTVLALAAVRIFILYTNVFGTLLFTGLGLIVSGLLLLALIWGWLKLSRRIKGRK
jgi:hypothetical protein